jgi:hypothetical protein
MKTNKTAHVPKVGDDAVKAKTGRTWSGWFGLLDKAGAKKLTHGAIAGLLVDKHGVPGWWSQMVTVEYELSRGLREQHQKSDGYSVSATKTIATSLASLFEATVNQAQRKQWFPKGVFKLTSKTKNKYANGEWKEAARLNVGFYTTGTGKAQIAIQVSKLATRRAVEGERKAWKAALAKLQTALEE